MKQNEKKRDWLNIEYRRVQNKKLVVTICAAAAVCSWYAGGPDLQRQF